MTTTTATSHRLNISEMSEEVEKRKGKFNERSKPEKPRFRLKFAKSLEIGRSELSNYKLPNHYEPVVTSKFYSAFDGYKSENDETVSLIAEEISRAKSLGPREKYEEPILESQRYGWYQEKFLVPDPELEKIHFPKRTSEMVKVQNLLHNEEKAKRLYDEVHSKIKPDSHP